MRLKDIKKIYLIDGRKFENKYLVFSKEVDVNSRLCHKYFCLINFKKNKAWVDDFSPTSKIEVLQEQINYYIKSLKYDSDYYCPTFRKGYFEELVINDYLKSLGFEYKDSFMGYENYILKTKSVYDVVLTNVSITIKGLSPDYNAETHESSISKNVTIHVNLADYSWIESKCNRNVEDIKACFDSLLKPLMVSESVNSFNISEKLKNADFSTDVLLKTLMGNLDVSEKDFKNKLKANLLKMAESL